MWADFLVFSKEILVCRKAGSQLLPMSLKGEKNKPKLWIPAQCCFKASLISELIEAQNKDMTEVGFLSKLGFMLEKQRESMCVGEGGEDDSDGNSITMKKT